MLAIARILGKKQGREAYASVEILIDIPTQFVDKKEFDLNSEAVEKVKELIKEAYKDKIGEDMLDVDSIESIRLEFKCWFEDYKNGKCEADLGNDENSIFQLKSEFLK